MRVLVPVLFTLSGFSALVYEITWSRQLALILGSTTHAVSLVLAVYMAGFALGGRFGGTLAGRCRCPFRAFGWIQLGLAGLGLGFPVFTELLLRAEAGPLRFAGELPSYVGSALWILAATFGMGITLPLVAATWIRDPGRVGSQGGLLAGVNLLGAALGALASSFLLIRFLGMEGALRVAAAGNAIVFLGSRLHRQAGEGAGIAAGESFAAPEPRSASRPAPAGVVALLGVAGFCSIGLQVSWTRILTFFLEGFTYTFSAIVGTYLTGLFLGSVVLGPLARPRHARGLLLIVSAGWAVSTVVALAVLIRVPGGPEEMRLLFSSSPGAFGFGAGLFLAIVSLLGIPTFFLGGLLPVAAAASIRDRDQIARGIGVLYAAENAGGAIGALLTGMVLLELFPPKLAVVLLASLGIVALAVVVLRGDGRLARRGAAVAVAVGGLIAAAWLAEPFAPLIRSSHVFRGSRGPEHELVATASGPAGVVSVVDNLRTGERFLYTDDFLAAGTGDRYHYMRLLGHLPALLARERDTALVIGFGSGTTVGSLARHPFSELRCVEIVPEVLSLADRFASVNAGVRDDPRLELAVGDGRHRLRVERRRYDVITLEPLMPYTPGAVALYTSEFYELGRARLREGGRFCQWIPLHAMRTAHLRQLLAAFVGVFPDTWLFVYETSAVLVGSPSGIDISWEELARRAEEPAVQEDLAEAGFPSPASLASAFVTGGEPFREWIGGAEAMTDDRPVLEFFPLPRSTVTTFGGDNVLALEQGAVDPRAFLFEEPPERELDRRIAAFARAGAELRTAIAAARLASYFALVGDGRRAADLYGEAERRLGRSLAEQPLPLARRWLTDLRYRDLVARGGAHLADGEATAAAGAYREAIRLDPARHLAHAGLGRALLAAGRLEEARTSFREALARYPRDAASSRGLREIAARLEAASRPPPG